jgi:hypothetical protein
VRPSPISFNTLFSYCLTILLYSQVLETYFGAEEEDESEIVPEVGGGVTVVL